MVMLRDSGLLRAALRVIELEQMSALQKGHSWEGFATEALCHEVESLAPPRFYRDREGNEVDLVLDFRPIRPLCFAIEFKVNEAAMPEAGFWEACKAISPTHKLMVHSGERREEAAGGDLKILPLLEAVALVRTSVLGA